MTSRRQKGKLKRKDARLLEKGEEFKIWLCVFWMLALKLAETVTRFGILTNLVKSFIQHILTQLFYSSLKIVDDDIDWKQMVKEEEEVEDDEEEAPVVRTKLTLLNYY